MILPDILQPGLRAVFCGTRAGTTSGERGHYYSGRGNKFWLVLFATGLTSHQLAPSQYERLREFNLGLTDLGKNSYGPDTGIRRSHLNVAAFREKIAINAPRWVAFNGLGAARKVLGNRALFYGPRSDRIAQSAVYVLPSTSGAANGSWDPEWWARFAELLRER